MAVAPAWGVVPNPEDVSLEDIMSEQLVDRLKCEKNKSDAETCAPDAPYEPSNECEIKLCSQSPTTEDCDQALSVSLESDAAIASAIDQINDISNDVLLAAVLQAEFDAEFDEQLLHEERRFNGDSKVSVNYSNYRLYNGGLTEPRCSDMLYSSDEDVYSCGSKNLNGVDSHNTSASNGEHPVMPPCGYLVKDGEIITKHDASISGQKNAFKLMDLLPPEISTGDAFNARGRVDSEHNGSRLAVNDRVLNTLRRHASCDERRHSRHHREKSANHSGSGVIDSPTRAALLKLISAGTLERLGGVLSCGKEAYVLSAAGGSGDCGDDRSGQCSTIPPFCAVKVYRRAVKSFGAREKYIRDDRRFRERLPSISDCGGSISARRMVCLWAEKEMLNLQRMTRSGVRCPRPVALEKNVLVMSLIGSDGQLGGHPAQQLRHCRLSTLAWGHVFGQVVDTMRKLYWRCNLVHGDLSEYNILYHDEACWIIDVGQAVEVQHPLALSLLYRDCSSICRFFGSRSKLSDFQGGVSGTQMTPAELFTFISDLRLDEGCDDIEGQLLRHQQSLSHNKSVDSAD